MATGSNTQTINSIAIRFVLGQPLKDLSDALITTTQVCILYSGFLQRDDIPSLDQNLPAYQRRQMQISNKFLALLYQGVNSSDYTLCFLVGEHHKMKFST